MDSKTAREMQTLTLDDILANPTRYGMPSFDEFRKAPDKWRKRPDDVFTLADGSTRVFRGAVAKQVYFIKGYKCDNLEKVERIAKEEGMNLYNLEMIPEVKPISSSQCEIHITFKEKAPKSGLIV